MKPCYLDDTALAEAARAHILEALQPYLTSLSTHDLHTLFQTASALAEPPIQPPLAAA